jgi:hypothetical protein
MSLHRDLHSQLKVASTVPSAVAAGTVSSTAFKLTGAVSGSLRVFTGAATGTPSAVSLVGRLMVADDDGTGAPGSFSLYTGPDGVAASVAVTAVSSTGSVGVHLEGSVTKVWGKVEAVTSFTAGTSPTLAGLVVFVMNDQKIPASAVEYAA